MNKLIILVIASIFLISLTSCEGCSLSGRRKSKENQNEITSNSGSQNNNSAKQDDNPRQERESFDKFTVKMTNESGVYLVPVEINGSNMKFIFDTGASDITISNVEAMFLIKQGNLSEEDVLGSENYQIADGSIAEGTIINLRTVKLGNRTLKNVKASIVHNDQAPLLLGQSALAQFGKVSIDYDNNEITFE